MLECLKWQSPECLNPCWAAGGREAIRIRRPPLAVRRACLRRRAFYASPCQATAPSLERFTHRAHSAGPLRPEVELTPSKVRKPNPCFIDVRCFFKTILGSKMDAKMEANFVSNRAQEPSDAPGARLPGDASPEPSRWLRKLSSIRLRFQC